MVTESLSFILIYGFLIDTIVKVGKKVWDLIKGQDKAQDEISQIKGYNPQKSEANDIAELSKLLTEYRQNIITAGEELEREMIVECSMELQEIMEVFEKFNENLKIARSESVKRKFRRLSAGLKGTFSEYIGKRVSLDDDECIKILKLPSGELKNQRLQELKQNVFVEATNAMIEKIKDTVDDFSETVEDAFLEHLERTEASMEEKTIALEKLSTMTDENIESAEAVLLKAHYILSVCYYTEEL